MTGRDRVVLVGGGPAAWRCGFALRERGFEGPLMLVGEEPRPPYDRTMVSKDLLTREPPEAELALSPHGAYADAGIELRLGVAATRLDTERRRVQLSDGEVEPYDALLIATGGRPRLPESLRCPGVHVLRTLQHAERFARELERGGRVVIVGGGLIAGEVATAALARGAEVTMLEALETPLARGVGVEIGRRIERMHRDAGVDLRVGAVVERITRSAAGYEVAIAGAAAVTADSVVVAIGIAPATDWLLDAPALELDDGVATDDCCRTRATGVFAAGDCARWSNRLLGRLTRVEHWDTAVRHGEAAAASMLGAKEPFCPIPFVWSLQHGRRLQWVGETADADRVEVEDLESGPAARYWRGDRLCGGFAVDAPRFVGGLRRELELELQPTTTTT
ncbi:MAG: 3-phenylpropionate/trans-cinnamate dioxygenase ferredoxin reductase component [Thermoleophilaceae bacterium]|jgi:3-phenylpropionate/trans-cinnamate dioxygenase ferredoxin reductase subunit|nr:3-phenylpropionate/trans-cinnamate dioxygenase ferredoxin reductase component [Thermoleophilaceae bacterium]